MTNSTNILTRLKPEISSRELEVMELVSLGMLSKEISEKLFISPYTVNDHRRNMMRKLNANNVASLIRKGFQLGYLSVETDQEPLMSLSTEPVLISLNA